MCNEFRRAIHPLFPQTVKYRSVRGDSYHRITNSVYSCGIFRYPKKNDSQCNCNCYICVGNVQSTVIRWYDRDYQSFNLLFFGINSLYSVLSFGFFRRRRCQVVLSYSPIYKQRENSAFLSFGILCCGGTDSRKINSSPFKKKANQEIL